MLNQYVVKQCNAIRRELGKEQLSISVLGEVGDQNVLWDVEYVHNKFGCALSCFIDGSTNCQMVKWADPRTRQVCVYNEELFKFTGEHEVFTAHQFQIVKDGKVVLGWGI